MLPDSTKTDIGLFLDFANVWGVDYDSSIDDSNKIRSSTGVAANWLSPIGPLSFTFAQIYLKLIQIKQRVLILILGTTF